MINAAIMHTAHKSVAPSASFRHAHLKNLPALADIKNNKLNKYMEISSETNRNSMYSMRHIIRTEANMLKSKSLIPATLAI